MDLISDLKSDYERDVLRASDLGFRAWLEIEHEITAIPGSLGFEELKAELWDDYIELLTIAMRAENLMETFRAVGASCDIGGRTEEIILMRKDEAEREKWAINQDLA